MRFCQGSFATEDSLLSTRVYDMKHFDNMNV